MDFSAKNIAGQIASIKSDTLANLLDTKASATFDLAGLSSEYMAAQQADSTPTGNTVGATSAASSIAGLSPTGRNTALADPESAYQMMSRIQYSQAMFQIQHVELGDMAQGVRQLGQQAASLSATTPQTPLAQISQQLQSFADQYNSWRREYADAVEDPNRLGNTQAAQLARHEFAASVNSPFHGANQGVSGLSKLGLSTDAQGMLQLNTQQLAQAWQERPDAAAAAIGDFSQHFSQASQILLAPQQTFAKQLDNLDRAIHYIDTNDRALQSEFGLGDPPQLSPQLQKILAHYQAGSSIA